MLSYQRLLRTIRPHAPVFKQWIAMKQAESGGDPEVRAALRRLAVGPLRVPRSVHRCGRRRGRAGLLRWRSSLRIADDVVALDRLRRVVRSPQRQAATPSSNARFATFLRASRYTKAQIAKLTSDLL